MGCRAPSSSLVLLTGPALAAVMLFGHGATARGLQRELDSKAKAAHPPVVPTMESPPDQPFAQPCLCETQDQWGFRSQNSELCLGTGEFITRQTDLVVQGRGLDFVWARKYRSANGPDTLQGNGWDFSYNLFIEAASGGILVHDGNTRADLYELQSSGNYEAREFFREGFFHPDGRFTLLFGNHGTWNFFALDGSAHAGRIESIIDPNNNQMTFQYDPNGRLTQIIDTLNRPYQVTYDADGFLQSVVDFGGRSVVYDYYEDGDAGGAAGDLKSVTSPVVTGTSTGNDFPAGKTTTYTYSTGFGDERLNHNLLTIQDPLGHTFLTNEYATTPDDTQLRFDRILGHALGNPENRHDIRYFLLHPVASREFATQRIIVNDPVGNVSESFFDAGGREVITRDFTGRADSDAPTTRTENRPQGRLRPSDPRFFETRRLYNFDSLVVWEQDPNTTLTQFLYESELDPLAPALVRGNLREVLRTPGGHLPGGDQPALVEQYDYWPGFGQCGDQTFVSNHVDPKNNVTTYQYDAAGNLLQRQGRVPGVVEDFQYNVFGQQIRHIYPDNGSGHRREDAFTYYGPADGAQNGYRSSWIQDDTVLALTTSYQYDGFGNCILETAPTGHATTFDFNSLDQCILLISREVVDGSGIFYDTSLIYDANDNLVRSDRRNLDEVGVPSANGFITWEADYDLLNHLIRLEQEEDAASDIVTEFEYDGNCNQVLIRKGEAVNGNQPDNVVQFLFDERDLLFQEVRAPESAGVSTTQWDYDPNQNVVAIRVGMEDGEHRTVHTYDGYDRCVSTADPMGNTQQRTYDPNGNVTHILGEGELNDQPGSVNNERLFEAVFLFDDENRLIRCTEQHFHPATQAPVGDGDSVMDYVWGDAGRLLSMTDDGSSTTQWQYDTLLRVALVEDAAGNQTVYSYDDRSNVTAVTETEKSQGGSPDQVFVTTMVYDNLDRQVRVTDPAGDTRLTEYDSRNNPVRKEDGNGTEQRLIYDGLDRLVGQVTDLDGDGAAVSDLADQWIAYGYDDSHRPVTWTDDNGNVTTCAYDALDRVILETLADGTSRSVTYDAHDQAILEVDANGTSFTGVYDGLDRLISRSIAPGAGVSNETTFEAYEYDGMSRVVRAEDDDSVVQRHYDSLGNVIEESLAIDGGPPLLTTGVYDGVGNRTQCTYPGGRVITTTFDSLHRIDTVADLGGTLADYDFFGPWRVESLAFGNSVVKGMTYDLDRRPEDLSYVLDPFGVNHTLYDHHFDYDANDNRVADLDSQSVTDDRHFQYDDLDRLVGSERIPPGGSSQLISYGLDGAGNRTTVVGGPNPGSYTMDPTQPNPADTPVHQYTATPFDSRLYDSNGNLVVLDAGLSSERLCVYDGFDRMVCWTVPSTGIVHEYDYDALGRRVRKVEDATGSATESRYYYDGAWNVVEERDGNGATTATYVYGIYVDEVVHMERGGQDYYFHADPTFSTRLVTNGAGTVVEQYHYDDFGRPHVEDGTGLAIGGTAIGNPYLFTGRRWDAEIDWYHYRHRCYDPDSGRFTTRDPLGLHGDPDAHGNPLNYAGGNPWSRWDPFGLDDITIGIVFGLGSTHNGRAGGAASVDFVTPLLAFGNEHRREGNGATKAWLIGGQKTQTVKCRYEGATFTINYYATASAYSTAFRDNKYVIFSGHANNDAGCTLTGPWLNMRARNIFDASTIKGDYRGRSCFFLRCTSRALANHFTSLGANAYGTSGCAPMRPRLVLTLVTELVRGKTPDQAVKTANSQILDGDAGKLERGTKATPK